MWEGLGECVWLGECGWDSENAGGAGICEWGWDM